MAGSSIDLSDRRQLQPLAELLRPIHAAAGDAPLLLVGATARDLLLVHCHGLDVQRATEDTDVALAVQDWSQFLRIRQDLIDSGEFTPQPPQHRLWRGEHRVDLIPFGGVERPDRSIEWPPDGDVVMNVLGFSEALDSAIPVVMTGGLVCDVASLPAQALLKIWAWSDRKVHTPGKDAGDLWLLLSSYAEAGNVDRLYDSQTDVLTTSGFDVEEGGAQLLGLDARHVLDQGPRRRDPLRSLEAILKPEIDPEGALRLVGQMPTLDRERSLTLLIAFHRGLMTENPRRQR